MTGVQTCALPIFLDINFDDFSVADNSGQGNHGTNTNVTFSVVKDNNVTLTNLIDYKFITTTFQIINNELAWTKIFLNWNYLQNTETQNVIDRLESNFTLGIDKVSNKIPIVFSIGMIILVLLILILLIGIYKKISMGAGL